MSGVPICVTRRYQDKDKEAVKEIMTQCVMEKVHQYYFGILFSYAPLQLAVTAMAVLFIFFGIPFKLAFIAFPLTVLMLYVLVWSAHMLKASEIQNDLNNVTAHYMDEKNTCFYVAEVYIKKNSIDEFSQIVNKVKKLEFDFLTEREFEVKDVNLAGLRPVVAGCIAISQSFIEKKRARIKRFGVLKIFRRRHLATVLLQTAVEFCTKAKYEEVEAVTTEYHSEADFLFSNENFRRIPSSCKSYMFLDEMYIYTMFKDLTASATDMSGRNTPEIAGP